MKKGKIQLFKNQILITSIVAFALVLSIVGSSYAIFTSSVSSDEFNYLKVGKLELSYVDTGNGYGDVLSLNGAYPMTDNEGKNTTPYRFYIKNVGDVDADFKIKIKNDESIIELEDCGDNLLDYRYIRVQFDSTGTVYTLSDLLSSDYTLYEKKNLIVGASEIHEIRIWLAADAPNSVLGTHYHGKVVIELTQAGIDAKYANSYDIGDRVSLVDGSKWHVLEKATTTDTVVTLISDYNLNGNGSYCTSGTCDTMAFDSTRTNTNNTYCTDITNGCNMYEKNNNTVLEDSSIKTWLETTYRPLLEQSILNANGTTEDLVVTLPTMNQIAKADYKTFDQNVVQVTNNNFLVTSTYWTKTPYNNNTSSLWYVSQSTNQNDLIYANNSTTIGVRPVITVSKINIVTE